MEQPLSSSARELLDRVSRILLKEKLLAQHTGAEFNIFEVLRLSSNELAHSSMLAGLLDPNGSHGQGVVFLQAFVEVLHEGDLCSTDGTHLRDIGIADSELEYMKVSTEAFIGKREKESGGRVDILIRNGGKMLVIENKIYAGLQENQLERYLTFSNGQPVFFLTLDKPDNAEAEREIPVSRNLYWITYRSEILKWLERCEHLSLKLPHLRESISQYIALIKKLTQSGNTGMMNEITDIILKDPLSFRAYEALKQSDKYVFDQMDRKLLAIGDSIALGLNQEGIDVQHVAKPIFRNKRYQGLGFVRPHWEKFNLIVGIHFSETFYNGVIFGIAYTKENREDPLNSLAVSLNGNFRSKFQGHVDTPSSWWPASTHYEEPLRYWNSDTFEDILFSDPESGKLGKFGEDLREKIEAMVALVDDSLSAMD